MNSYVLGFQDIDRTKLVLVGGKGANLGELSRIEGIQVPEGFCVTTLAYKELIANNQEYNALLEQLSLLKADNREEIGEISAKIRQVISNCYSRRYYPGGLYLSSTTWRKQCPCGKVQRNCGGFADSFICRPARYLSEHSWKGSHGVISASVGHLFTDRRDLPHPKRLRSPQGPPVRGHSEDGFSRGSRDCSLPTPSPPTVKYYPLMPVSGR